MRDHKLSVILCPFPVRLLLRSVDKGHLTEKCFKLNGPIIQRRENLRAVGLCFQCLQPGHIAKGCARVCYKCSGRHHELLCVPASGRSSGTPAVPPGESHVTTSADDNTEPATTSHVSASHCNTNESEHITRPAVALQFARVKVRGCRVLLRSQSCSTLVRIVLIWHIL